MCGGKSDLFFSPFQRLCTLLLFILHLLTLRVSIFIFSLTSFIALGRTIVFSRSERNRYNSPQGTKLEYSVIYFCELGTSVLESAARTPDTEKLSGYFTVE